MKALIKVQINEDVYYCDKAEMHKNYIRLIDIENGYNYYAVTYFNPKKDKVNLSIYYVEDKTTQ